MCARVGNLRQQRDLGDVVRERVAVDHRVGIIEDHGSMALRQGAREQFGLPVLHIRLQFDQRSGVVDGSYARESVHREKCDDVVDLVGAEESRIGVEHERIHVRTLRRSGAPMKGASGVTDPRFVRRGRSGVWWLVGLLALDHHGVDRHIQRDPVAVFVDTGSADYVKLALRGETTLAATDLNQTAMCPPSNLAGRVKPISIRCSISDRRVDSKRLIGVRVVPPDEGATSGAESRQSTERQQRRADDRRLGVRRRVQQELNLVSS